MLRGDYIKMNFQHVPSVFSSFIKKQQQEPKTITMKLLVVTCLVAITFADKLDNTYLPPSSASSAGGNSNFLHAPSSSNFRSSGGVFNSAASSSSGVYSAPQNYNNFAILRYNAENPGNGNYRFEYETGNKISQHEVGELKNVGTDQEANVVTGSYSYTGPDGHVYAVDYVADENGFRASGAHLPTPPPIPKAILESLQQNTATGSFNGYSSKNNGGYRY